MQGVVLMPGDGSAPSCCAFTHMVAFEKGSGPFPPRSLESCPWSSWTFFPEQLSQSPASGQAGRDPAGEGSEGDWGCAGGLPEGDTAFVVKNTLKGRAESLGIQWTPTTQYTNHFSPFWTHLFYSEK